ncbi:unnamed protein product [Sphagnum balticum]
MAVRITTSKFLESQSAKSSVLNGINDPLPDGGGPLPNNIKGGVAKLLDIYFEKDEKFGEGFRAIAEVVLPEVHEGQYIKGKKTKQWVTFNEGNISDRIVRIRDIIKGLGGVGIFEGGKNINFFKIVEFLDTATKRNPIYFAFSTSPKETDGDWPWENWYKAIPGFKEPTSTASPNTDQKKTSQSTSVNGSVSSNGHTSGLDTTNPKINPTAPSLGAVVDTPTEQSVPNPDDTYTDTDDLQSIIQRAVNKDRTAQEKLEEWAKELDYTDEDLENADSWSDIGLWVSLGIRKGENKGDAYNGSHMTTDTSVSLKKEIKVNEVYTYSPPDKRDDTKRLKGRECRVLSVDNIRNIVKLQNLAKKNEEWEVSIDELGVNLK